jgi:hypothetical protein
MRKRPEENQNQNQRSKQFNEITQKKKKALVFFFEKIIETKEQRRCNVLVDENKRIQ